MYKSLRVINVGNNQMYVKVTFQGNLRFPFPSGPMGTSSNFARSRLHAP